MKVIQTRQQELVDLCDIDPGECFEWAGNVYIRATTGPQRIFENLAASSSVFALRCDGTLAQFNADTQVLPLKADLVIK